PSAVAVADNMTKTANGFFTLIQAIVVLVGFVITCIGVFTFYKVTKEKGQGQSSIGMALAGCFVGVLMIMLPLTIGSLGKSVFGDQAGRATKIDLSPT
ncbi:MAG: hypothetical protein ACREXR_23130, partial [Gammaproteobacteria bacterium]